ncbi:1-deoxy-D-xylulose-5-phosphate reductoisomerase [Clostridium pasteurianum]|uniref:1-deoxy-D-xylulose 5-phosphate reductoisomerase n=1 Tax=Clostridium pasteurianum BC1 TaxID=86416 RepID=R4KA73_CLOPA|nr:1-deoxy-D-xylulose-5-phosphate reductoisomerase [Clostridium pasteurianum]AGK97444.1 1-deoxy-D-xylulose 5-phosphate reductoisomerase [Clostridium pasteurianum BC1]
MKNISILGATGSVGIQTLDVLKNDRENFKLLAVTANKNYSKIIEIINEFNPKLVALMDNVAAETVRKYCIEHNKDIEVLAGLKGLTSAATLKEVDMVVTSVVGMIGLVPTIEAIKAGKTIALANKETLVVGGSIVINEAIEHKVKILPVDSEHGAIFQCIEGNNSSDISKILLTASGGPFRGKKRDELTEILPKDALKHPKWNMGNKISIDSATLMNKGLEVIEAHWLFSVPYEDIEVVVHPQSIIHSMVQYCDGTVLSQMATADMRLPIQYALNYPKRGKRIIDKLDFYSLDKLSFEKPDIDTFGCLKLAYEVGKKGGNLPTILNAANEVAVELFLKNKINFLEIEDIIKDSLEKFQYRKDIDIDIILDTDVKVRSYVDKKYNV